MPEKKEKISIVFPVYNEKENIGELYRQVREACSQAGVDYEMIFVDDGRTDGSLEAVKAFRSNDNKVRYCSFSRNFGHQIAFFAGMAHATGDGVITMDADLQHPPSLIPKMVELWRGGADVVYTTKRDANVPPIRSVIVRGAYWFISKVSGLALQFGQSDFRLIDKKVLDVLTAMPECHKFLRGQVSWVGFNQKGLSYDVGNRHSGVPKYSFRSLAALALDGIFSFGRYPLHLVMLFGMLVFFCSSAYICFVLAAWVLKLTGIIRINMPPGYTDIIMAVCFLGSVQIMAIGILSEYVGRIYEQTKGRPVFIVREGSEKANEAPK